MLTVEGGAIKAVKPMACLSLDLDNQWSYMKTHCDKGWESFPSYLEVVVPRVLNFLRDRNLAITFFIVGQDAALEKNYAALRSIAAAGHEIGNHSFHHESWLHSLGETEIEAELVRAESQIEEATGQHPVGFRGPGYCCSPEILRVLARRDYLYDASTLPTFLGPLARAYYFMSTRLGSEDARQRRQLFGTLRDGLRPIGPYRWHLGLEGTDDRLVEIPVTTMPVFRLPFHFSYVLYLSTFSQTLAMLYFRMALTMCRARGLQPSLLLHPLDFVDVGEVPELAFFPAMRLAKEKKLKLVSWALRLLSSQFSVLTMRQYAYQVALKSRLVPAS